MNKIIQNLKATNELLFFICNKNNISLGTLLNDNGACIQYIIDDNNILISSGGWIDIDNPPKKSGRYLCQLKLRDGTTKIEINYLFSDDNDYNKKFLGVTHWQYLPDEAESENE